MNELAVFGLADGRVLIGKGPFRRESKSPSEGVAFYRNDFSLSEERPWLVPTSVEVREGGCGSAPEQTVAWRSLEVGPFAKVFGEVSESIRKGEIEKTVPVVTESGEVTTSPFTSILPFIDVVSVPLRVYGWSTEGEGFIGASPELLFRLEGGDLQTMALAGTARSTEQDAFAVDEKEIREHEFVAQTLLAKMSDLGLTRRHDREIMELPGLVHFHSKFEVELYRDEDVDGLIRRFHPTPALGPLPRTAETMGQLISWRERLGCPAGFGAPFGVSMDGVVEILVAIRMVSWKGHELVVPSGCGVIEESRLVNEWRELRLKREAVKKVFGLA